MLRHYQVTSISVQSSHMWGIPYNAAVYPSCVLNSGKKVNGTKLPAACAMAARACNMKVPRLANLASTRVGRFVRLRDGGVDNATGMEMPKLTNPKIRSVQAAPNFASNARAAGAYASPPRPAAERMMPIAEPRCASKYSGATDTTGK